MNPEEIGKIIKDIRQKHNMSQKDFADKFGVTYQAVSKWENGKNIPDIAILKEISEEYEISLDDVLLNKKVNNHNKKIIGIITISLLTILILLMSLVIKNNDFEFKTITTNCSDFTVTGSMAYNKDKSSIYISHITYCGKEDVTKYKEINCTLYEVNETSKIIIDKCQKENNITLEDFLKNVKFNIDNYDAVCKKYSENSLYLEIDALTKNESIITYKVPLKIEDNCK
ncbi:MAG: helix-turn-helix transcriptional regulator [Bacilli bacterium]|nr:helix-turn-helix transcriptional regulator [Bacilli bacterium]